MTTSSWAVIVASGKEEMLNPDTCTAFLNLQNKPILSYSLTTFEHSPEIDGVVIVAPRERLEQVASVIQLFGCHKVRKIVPGGATQYASFVNGMKYVDEGAEIILMHEASRPNITPGDISEIVKTTKKNDYAVLGRVISEETAMVTERTSVVEKFLAGGSIWSYGSPVSMKAAIYQKAQSAVKKKGKAVKTLMEAVALTGVLPRVIQAHAFPMKINSFEQLQQMEFIHIAIQ